MSKEIVYPYIPNSAPDVKAAMLKDLGVSSVEEFYEDVPEKLRLKRTMDLPAPHLSEHELKKHVMGLLKKNSDCTEFSSFLGGGCYQHHVPAICDEVNRRGEFLTAYAGEPYDDHGRFQTLWEYASMMGELLNMDVVNIPTYDWTQAAATSCRMAARMNGRNEILVASTVGPDRHSKILDYCKPELRIKTLDRDHKTGQIDLDALQQAISENTAAIYFENPSYLGIIEDMGQEISRIARDNGAECIVGVDPISLGVLTPPADYGATIVCGDVQTLGIHMQYGGGNGGIIATHDDERYIKEYPSRLFGISTTDVKGEYGFGDVLYDRTSFGAREEGKEFVGTASALWGLTAGVYMALMGPKGMQEIGEGILQRVNYAILKLSELPGVKAPAFSSSHFKEFVVNFDDTGRTVAEINKALREKRIFGGSDLSQIFPELGNSALFCVTEIQNKEDIDQLVNAIAEIVK